MIKKYQDQDWQHFIEMFRSMHQESRFKDFQVNENKLRKIAENCYCSISYKSDEPTGMMLGVVQQMWFSDALVGTELLVYVKTEHRGGITAMRLIKDFESYCKSRGCKEINVGSSAEISTDLVKRLYQKLGYSECGFLAHKEI